MHVDQHSREKGQSAAVELPSSVQGEIALAYEWTTRALGYINNGGPWPNDMGDDPMGVLYDVEKLCGRLRLAGCDVSPMVHAHVDPLGFLIDSQALLSGLVSRS